MFSLSKAALEAEIDLAQRILLKWQKQLDAGIPVIDIPGSDDALERFTRELYAEAILLAGKFGTIAEVISNDLNG
jgi:hypothetical protein